MQVTSGIQCNLLSPSYSTIYAPQGDAKSRFVLIQLLEGAAPWEVPAGASVIIRAAKPDGTFCFYDTNEAGESAYTISGSTVTIELVGQVLAAPGPVLMQIDFYNAEGAHLSTFSFCCQVSESVVSDDDIVSSNYFSVLTATLTEMLQIEQAVKAAYGAPLVAATAAAMTDHTRIYVYTGSESGYTNGNWYYWDGSAWASGGVYNSSAVNVDSAPTQGSTNPVSSGGTYTAIANEAAAREAADTALGDELDDVKSALDNSSTQAELYGGYKTVDLVYNHGWINSSGVYNPADNRYLSEVVSTDNLISFTNGSSKTLYAVYFTAYTSLSDFTYAAYVNIANNGTHTINKTYPYVAFESTATAEADLSGLLLRKDSAVEYLSNKNITDIKNTAEAGYPYPFARTATLIGSDNTTKFYTPTGGGIKNLVIHNHGIGHDYYVQTFYKTANYRVIVIRGMVGNVTSIYLEHAVSGVFSGVETFSMQGASYDISCDCTVDWDVVNAGYGQNLTLQKAALSNAVIDNATMHVIVVDANGTGDYTTIQGAINAANDGDMIYIKSGWYEESVVNTKQIVVIGQDKESTVLFNATGEYATPPLWTCSGRWENLTVYAWNRDNKSFDSLTRLGYALHLDQKWDSVHSRRHIEIRNCTFKSDFNDCIGCGIDEDGFIEISDTICEATHRSGMKVHPFPVAGGTSKMILKNNVFKKGADDNAYGLMFHTGGTDNVNFNTVQVEAYNNIAKTYDGWNTNCFFMDDYNYGNTLAGMNRFSLS